MKTNLYVIYDSVADETVLCSLCKTDGLFVRQNLPYVSKINPNYEIDMHIYCIGQYVDSTMQVEPCPPRKVSWDSYKRPEEETKITPVVNK